MKLTPARTWQWFLLVSAALLPYLHTLDYGFINYDDGFAIEGLPLIRSLTWRSLPSFFVPDIYDGLIEYMPLKNLSYAVDYALFGASAAAFRPQQLIWYAASVVAAFAWLSLLFDRLSTLERLGIPRSGAAPLALGVSVLFALHPAHVESVTWLSGRKDVLSGAFLFAALGCGLVYSLRLTARLETESESSPGAVGHAAAYCVASLGCIALALLSKPTALMIAPLLAIQEFWIAPSHFATAVRRRARLRALAWLHLPAWGMTLAFGVFYTRLVASFMEPPGANPERAFGPAVRIGEQLFCSLQLALDPSALTPIVSTRLFDADPTSFAAVTGYLTLCVLGALILLGLRRRRPLALAILLFVVPIVPSLIQPVWGQYVAGRYLYHAVLGPIFALSWSCALALRSHARLRPLLAAAAGSLCLIWGSVTVAYSSAFRSSDALWAYAISVDPSFPRFYDMAARAALLRGDPQRAVALLERCVQLDGGDAQCAGPLGGLLLLYDPARAERVLLRALPEDSDGTAHLRLAQHWAEHGRGRDAVTLYEGWLHGRGSASPEQLGALVDLAIAAGQLDKARSYLRAQIAAASVLLPASPPPPAILRAAERTGDRALTDQVRAAANRCKRSDCFAAALGVLPRRGAR